MKGRLGLSEEQWEKLRPLLKEEGDKVREIIGDSSLSPEQKRAKAAEVTAGGREKIKDLLTPEQRQKLAEEMKHRPGPPGGPSGPPRLDPAQRLAQLKEKLGLTDEQVAKMKPIMAEEGPKLRALREDKSLSPEARRSAFEQSFEKIAAELTPSQREQMREEMRAPRK